MGHRLVRVAQARELLWVSCQKVAMKYPSQTIRWADLPVGIGDGSFRDRKNACTDE
ncbi:MAG: hypothetical protein HQ581_23270 [Planctomycetes bacterium]|nr:hypothetical protein [Planctomycetota bacterium]